GGGGLARDGSMPALVRRVGWSTPAAYELARPADGRPHTATAARRRLPATAGKSPRLAGDASARSAGVGQLGGIWSAGGELWRTSSGSDGSRGSLTLIRIPVDVSSTTNGSA